MRKCKAFTLLELLVVVALIALLVAILIPSLAKARTRPALATPVQKWVYDFPSAFSLTSPAIKR